jgi:uncharacterized glyoxalase superfamily protein PhnB
MKGKAVPEGFHTLTPYPCVKDAAKAIEFYKKAFGAEEVHVSRMPGGKIINAQLKIGDSMLMLNDEFPPHCVSAETLGGSPVSMHIYTEDMDRLYNQAVAAGATPTMPPMDAFWGDRYGQLKDPFGHSWSLATHLQDMTPEEMQKASEAFFAQQPR